MKTENLQYYCLTSNSRQQAHSYDSSALQKKMVLFINLLGKGLTQEIKGRYTAITYHLQEVISFFFEENKKLQAELEALHLSTEAEKKEINILSISLKHKDAEIDRLKELTGYDSFPFFVCFVFFLSKI